MKKITVFLADDHAVVREGLKRIMENAKVISIVGEATNGRETLAAVPRLKPDVLVTDMSMPEMNGSQVTRALLQKMPKLAVLILTVHEDKSYLRELMDAGARGYVLKRTAGDELIHAIRAVAAGHTYIDPRVADQMVEPFVRRKETHAGARLHLSDREQSVMKLIAQGYSNKEVGAKLEVSVKTIETHKTRSMKKLGLSSRVDIVRYAQNAGWFQDR